MMHRRISKFCGGFTLTELAIVMGVIGSILAAVWTASANVSARSKVEKARGQVVQILTNYRRLYAQHAVDSGDWADIAPIGVSAGFFPSEMITSGGNVLNPWGGAVWVRGDTTNNGIIISYVGLPRSACIAMASAQANAPDLITSVVGSDNPGPGPHWRSYPGSPAMDTATIDTYCSDNNTSEEVTFDYKAH